MAWWVVRHRDGESWGRSLVRYRVIVNGKSGTILRQGQQEVVARMEELFRQAGAEAEIQVATGPAIGEALDKALASDADAVILAGGDGTISSSLAQAVAGDKPIGILPLGTFNLLARDLDVPLELDEAIPRLVGAEIRPVDLAEVNGRLYSCNSMIGPVPLLARQRERLRGGAALTVVFGVLREAVRLMWRYPTLTIEVDLGEGPRQFKAGALAVTNNAYEDVIGRLFPSRATLDSGMLALYIVEHRSRLGMLWLMLALMLGRWKTDRDLEVLRATQLTVNSLAGHLRVSNDGELLHLKTPLRFRIRPGVLRMLVPQSKRAEQTE